MLLRLLKDLFGGARPSPGALVELAQARAAKEDFAGAEHAFRRAFEQEPRLARVYGANYAHALLLAQRWKDVSAALHGLNMLEGTGWLRSLAAARPVDKDGQPIPWLTYPALEFIEARIPTGARVFEWGCGNSTLWWAQRAAEVHAVENNAAWADEIGGRLPSNATLLRETLAAGYVDAIRRHPVGYFDVAIIDGEWRVECARAVDEHIRPDGFIVFDNSDRGAYRESLAAMAQRGWLRLDFFGLIPGYLYRNCTSVLFRDAALLKRGPLPSDHRSCLGPTCAQMQGE